MTGPSCTPNSGTEAAQRVEHLTPPSDPKNKQAIWSMVKDVVMLFPWLWTALRGRQQTPPAPAARPTTNTSTNTPAAAAFAAAAAACAAAEAACVAAAAAAAAALPTAPTSAPTRERSPPVTPTRSGSRFVNHFATPSRRATSSSSSSRRTSLASWSQPGAFARVATAVNTAGRVYSQVELDDILREKDEEIRALKAQIEAINSSPAQGATDWSET
ncbi:MAG: hypothetical protein M1817_002261 [Caeruleum heppii]|nr:MAG: hypothetical protein M1817_002261 [Caeruleum heppii]